MIIHWKEVPGRIYRDVVKLIPAILIVGIYFLIGKHFLYSLCPSVMMTGFPCPGCGMTRSVMMILRGDFAGAWQMHPFSYVLILFMIVFCVRRYLLGKDNRCMIRYAVIIGIGMIAYYIYRMVRFFPSVSPMLYYKGSLLNRIMEVIRYGTGI